MDTVEHAQMVEKQLDAMIQRRARKGDVDPDEQEAFWQASVRRYNARRAQENRLAWCEYHAGQAERLKRTMEPLIAFHEARAATLEDRR